MDYLLISQTRNKNKQKQKETVKLVSCLAS